MSDSESDEKTRVRIRGQGRCQASLRLVWGKKECRREAVELNSRGGAHGTNVNVR